MGAPPVSDSTLPSSRHDAAPGTRHSGGAESGPNRLPSSPSCAEPAGGAPDPYARQLPPDDLATYQEASAGADLGFEIRLIRTVLANLSQDPAKNHAALARTIHALLRAVYLQVKHAGDTDEMAELIQRVTDEVIEEVRHEPD